jgi:hypothetical protein
LSKGKDMFDGFGAASGKRYQSAKGRAKKKVKIKKDGTW